MRQQTHFGHSTPISCYFRRFGTMKYARGWLTQSGPANIRKRETAAHQLLNHMRDVIAIAMPNVRSMIIGGDFNTNGDEFANEATLKTLMDSGFANCMEKLPPARRVTHPGVHGYPDVTF